MVRLMMLMKSKTAEVDRILVVDGQDVGGGRICLSQTIMNAYTLSASFEQMRQ